MKVINILLYQILSFTIHGKYKKIIQKVVSVSDIQDYFEYILKQHWQKTGNPSIRIFVNEIETRITFKLKTGYYLKLLMPGTMKLLGSIKVR